MGRCWLVQHASLAEGLHGRCAARLPCHADTRALVRRRRRRRALPAVQHECIPQAILGMDVICQATSGMGKTAVFVISVLQQLEVTSGEVGALVLCHTRELAYQVRVRRAACRPPSASSWPRNLTPRHLAADSPRV